MVRALPTRIFALISLTIITICVLITRNTSNLDIAAWGVTFDLTLTIPLVWYFVVVKTGTAKPVTLIPVFIICMMLAAFVVPRGQQQFLHDLRWLSAPLEVVAVILFAKRAAAGNSRAAAIAMAEVEVLKYALFSWRKQPAEQGFTVHERNGWGTIVSCIVMLIGFESIGMHLLVQLWSVKAAWIVTVLDVYGALWLIGDYHALRLRPSYTKDGIFHLRYGLRWSAEIPLELIESIEEADGVKPGKGILKMAMLDDPKYLVRLRQPITAHGLAGFRRTIHAVAVLPDDIEAFDRALRR